MYGGPTQHCIYPLYYIDISLSYTPTHYEWIIASYYVYIYVVYDNNNNYYYYQLVIIIVIGIGIGTVIVIVIIIVIVVIVQMVSALVSYLSGNDKDHNSNSHIHNTWK